MYNRSQIDRRSDQDRRLIYDIKITSLLGIERRRRKRRLLPEHRQDWIRVPATLKKAIPEPKSSTHSDGGTSLM
jgi:hypothetical protein